MELFVALGIILFLALVAILVLIKNVIVIAQPNEVKIISGRTRVSGDGRKVGYAFLKGGTTLRVPILESVDTMDLTNMNIAIEVRGAYSKGGIPLTVQGVANVKVPGDEPHIHNAVERFLGKTRSEIIDIARETLEGNLRGVLSSLTPEQVNQDKEAFAIRLTEEGDHDLKRLGLILDNLKIQTVTDDVGYLASIGRKRSAEVRRNAQIAEAQAKAEAAEAKWRNTMEAELSKVDAQMQVAAKDNERRIVDARTKREAMIAEQQGEVQALMAQTSAEMQMQEARIDQTRLRLEADVIQPAEAERQQAEQQAKAAAAQIIEQGKATATVLKNLALTYRGTGASARDVLLTQKLVPLMRQVLEVGTSLKVDRLTVIGKGAGAGNSDLAGTLVNVSEQVKAATGIDVTAALRQRLASVPPPRKAT